MKFQAPKLGKQKEKDNAEYLLMINEYLDNWIERIQAPDAEYNLKTKITPDGVIISIKFGREKGIKLNIPDSIDEATLQKIERIKAITINKFFKNFISDSNTEDNADCNNDDDVEQKTEDGSDISITTF